MFTDIILSLLSLLKQKLYCDIESVVYIKNDEHIPDIHPKINVEYKLISNINDLEIYLGNKKIKKNFYKFRYFILHGCKMYLLLKDDDIAGHIFICKLSDFKPYLYNNHSVFNGDDTYYAFCAHTFDEYRGNRLHPYMNSIVLKDTIKKNEKVFATASNKNLIAEKGIERAGWLALGVLKYKSIGHITFVNTFKKFSIDVTKDE